jgi:hypothetical protein
MSDATLTETNTGPEIRPLQFEAVLRVAAALVAGVFAMLIFEFEPGSVVAFVYALPLAALAWQKSEKGWTRNPVIFFVLAALAVLAIFIEPSFVNMLTGFGFVAAAGLSTRGAGPDDGLRMAQRMLLDLLKTPFWMLGDALGALPLVFGLRKSGLIETMFLPVIAAGIFGVMLLTANPLLERLLSDLIATSIYNLLSWRLVIVLPFTLAVCWSVLRDSKSFVGPQMGPSNARWHATFFKPASVVATLLLLNLLFIVENLLDIQHVWQDGALPFGFTHAQYVHRGSYTLIITVIMAAGFIMMALRPGSATAESRFVRALVYLFAAQNFLLVASSAKRTLSYIADYGMTEWRLAGLIWMALVALGLAFTVMRIVQNRDNHWLVQVNVKAAALLMLFCAFADFRPFIADWNVDRTTGVADPYHFDVSYNSSLGITALPAFSRFLDRYPNLQSSNGWVGKYDHVNEACKMMRADAARFQSHWQSWTLRYAFLSEASLDPTQGCKAGDAVK